MEQCEEAKKNGKKKSKIRNNLTPVYRTFNLFRLWRKAKLSIAGRTKKRNMIVIIALYANITDTEKVLVVCTTSK